MHINLYTKHYMTNESTYLWHLYSINTIKFLLHVTHYTYVSTYVWHLYSINTIKFLLHVTH